MIFTIQPPSETFHTEQTSLKSIDVKPLIVALMCSYGWEPERAAQASQRYLYFLHLLRLYPDCLLIPTQDIDRVWHCHILQTRKYRQDCQAFFGYYLDHDPNLNLRLTPDWSLLSAFQQTKALFEQHFGIGSFDDGFDSDSNYPAPCCHPIAS